MLGRVAMPWRRSTSQTLVALCPVSSEMRRRQTQVPVEVVDQAKFERSGTWEAA